MVLTMFTQLIQLLRNDTANMIVENMNSQIEDEGSSF